ncbi:iron-sulfur cluster carrier protein ApbC [Marinobacterium arenosum]|uniref:iron-sulfur cluster carrier protein ApbC n=1 Tax=Marinobacterium arenosum TaxID=2862496 RepID=UPI001C981781|nr:iron-sulfur cluster carrier protein ApbC [Marinobacterium arenosum]MBY4678447.1 iron-sulfur cluster carrier protein ApbC [Marinobacterium arenosum]
MSDSTLAAVQQALNRVNDPYLQQGLLKQGALGEVSLANGELVLEVIMPYPAAGIADQLRAQIAEHCAAIEGVEQVRVMFSYRVEQHPSPRNLASMQGVKNIIAVASGKGGVGKSTTAVNLALAMAAEGARVGILDADIYGPSLGQMLGVPAGTRPQSSPDEKYFIPLQAQGLQAMSMAFLVDENTPMVWRGPMVSGAMQQLLNQTKWQDLDYLFIDMPPGTGDIQLTLSQKVPVSGSVVVTTPQDIALLDAIKGIEMFRKVDIPVLGIVENMSVHICSNCGHAEHIFGEGGGDKVAAQYDTQMLGSLPLAMSIRQQADGGHPTVVAEPDSQAAQLYRDIARKLAASLVKRVADSGQIPTISIVED